ncbi:hypothetical protein G9P44_001183 [Scheffersomyces stipitis]|nr:hypothetical protein G9P44_001183 [Scheffersomyces stipitis]
MAKNDLVLIDSDPEEGPNQPTPALKKHKPALSVTPFRAESGSSSSPSPSGEEVGSGRKSTVKIHPRYMNDDDDEIEALSVPSSLAPFNPHNHESGRKDSDSHNSDSDSNSDTDSNSDSADLIQKLNQSSNHMESDGSSNSSDEEIEPVSFGEVDEIEPSVIVETRRYLKQNGNMKFLEKYLPTAASSEDIVRLILQLGFIPRDMPAPNNANIMDLIRVLNHAMIKVKSIRERLDNVRTIDDVLDQIQGASKILVITGAGISTSLGIPDFRSSKGFYSMVQHLGLSDPQEVFDLEIFHADPSLFYSIAYMILPPEEIFSPLHSFIKVLQSKGKLLRNYTQNIDNLESYAGIKPDKLIQCHGSFASATCVTCKYQVKGETIFPQIRAKEIPYCPKCIKARKALLKKDDDAYIPESFGVFKPDITFFGEPLPKAFHDSIGYDLGECDLLISVGTSLKVAPVADIVDKVPENVPQILINKDPIDHCNFDVSLLGYCDDVASFLANRLGEDWNLPHKDYDSIRGEDPYGSNLEIDQVDPEFREYQIYNKTNETQIPDEIEEKLEQELQEEGIIKEHETVGESDNEIEEPGKEIGETEIQIEKVTNIEIQHETNIQNKNEITEDESEKIDIPIFSRTNSNQTTEPINDTSATNN